jgi:hypothetical protein
MDDGAERALYFLHNTKVCANAYRLHAVFDWHPCQTTYFYLQPQKISKKGRSPNYVLHPIIFEI